MKHGINRGGLSIKIASREESDLSSNTPSVSSFRFTHTRFSHSQSPRFSMISGPESRRSSNGFMEKYSNLTTDTEERIRLSSFKNASSKDIFNTMFPDWLKERKDFQDTIKKFDNIDLIDLGKVCEKSPNKRTAIEKKALIDWVKDTPFFYKVGKHTMSEVCDKFQTVYFKSGDFILREGSPGSELYIILKGKVDVIREQPNRPVATLTSKNVVGEHSMLTHTPRNATIMAKTDVVTLSLSRDDYDAFISKMRQKEKYRNLELLRTISLFRDWQITKLNLLATNIFTVHFPKDRIIYNFEENPLNFYIVKQGCVDLEIILKRQDGNRWPSATDEWEISTTTKKYVKNVKVCKKGDFFGEKELIMNRKRDTRAVSKSDHTVLLLLNAEMFDIIFTHNEKKALVGDLKHRPTTADFQQELTDRLTQGKQKIHALLEAAQINQVKGGRLAYETREIRRKAKWLNVIISRTNQDLRRNYLGSFTTKNRENSQCG